MKTNFAAAGLAMLAACLVGTLAVAQQAATNQGGRSNATNQNRDTDNSPSANSRAGVNGTNSSTAPGDRNLSSLDDKTSGGTIRTSQLVGANIKNSAGEAVGEINDLVIDQSGKVRYAAITYGGFLGVGSKMFAVPFEAFKVRQNPNDPDDHDDYVLTLDVTKEQLDGDQGFDSDNWPNFADTKFTQDLDRRYKINRTPSLRTGADATGAGSTRTESARTGSTGAATTR